MTMDYFLFFFLGGVAWGTSFLFAKLALLECDFLEMVAWRLSIGAMAAFFILLIKGPLKKISLRDMGHTLIYGIIMGVVPMSLIAWGLKDIPSGTGGLLNSLTPLMTLILSLCCKNHRQHITKNIVGGIILGLIGVCFIFHKNLLCGHHFTSQMAVVLATFFYGAAILYYKSCMTHIPPFLALFWMFFWQGVVMWLLVLLLAEAITWPIAKPTTWISLLWMGIMGGVIAMMIQMHLIKRLGALKASNVAYLFPVSAYILGCVFLGESFSLWESFGIVFILSGIYLSKR